MSPLLHRTVAGWEAVEVWVEVEEAMVRKAASTKFGK
jgi:hypothetical protein